MDWIITLDHLDDELQGYGLHSELKALSLTDSREARHVLVGEYLAAHGHKLPFEFRLLDDDREPYYTGRCGDLDNATQDVAFAPLDWSMDQFGCTTMEYRRLGETKWEIL